MNAFCLSPESEALNKLDKYAVLIVDDIGYVRKTEQESSVLFELIAHRYERHSLVITGIRIYWLILKIKRYSNFNFSNILLSISLQISKT